MKFSEAEKYIGELTNTEPWLADTTHHLNQIFSIPATLRAVAKNKAAIVAFANELPDGPIRTMGKGDKASNAEVIAAYGRLLGKDVEYTDIVSPGAKNVLAFLACSYSGKTGDLIHRMKLLKEKNNAKFLGITNKYGRDDAPAGTIYDICDAVLHQPLPDAEATIVSSMSSFGVTFAGLAALDIAINKDERVFNLIEVLAERVKLQLHSQEFWNESLELARLLIKTPSYWLATDEYLGAILKININLREQSGLHVSTGLIDDFSHSQIGLVDSTGAAIIAINTPDVLDKENFKKSLEMIRTTVQKSGNLELSELKFRESFVENVSDIYMRILGAGYMASMLREIDPNAARSFIDKVRSY